MATLLTVIWHISHTFSYTLPENHKVVFKSESPLEFRHTGKYMHCTDAKQGEILIFGKIDIEVSLQSQTRLIIDSRLIIGHPASNVGYP